MKIIGHTNMDLDSLGSMVLAGYLYPDHQQVSSRIIHPIARGVYNLYRNRLNFLSPEDLSGGMLERAVIVDTRKLARVREFLDYFPGQEAEYEIYDHHMSEDSDFPSATVHQADCGSNTTLLCLELVRREITVRNDDATIAMAGIYSDTGYFTHENVCNSDFQAASYLMDCGASIPVISSYMKALKEDHQIELFHEIINRMVYQEINGHFMIFSFIVMEKQAGGLAAIVEKIGEIENPDAVMAVFYFRNENNVLLVGRSRSGEIDCEAIMKHFGGGGHPRSASALVRNMSGRAVLEALLGFLHSTLRPAVVAGSVMQREIHCIQEGWSMLEASMFLERIDHSGAPVVDGNSELVGILTLKNIMKARKAGQMHVPVKSHMRTRIITCDINTTLRNVEDLLYRNNIGHLPVMEKGRMAGFLTRTDLIRAAGGSRKRDPAP